MKFSYQARTKSGDIQSGVVEAFNKETALTLLQRHGLFITFLEEEKVKPIYAKQIKLFSGISKKDKAVFARQLSIMFKSKVPITEALRVMVSQTGNPNFKEKILKIAEDVEAGASLSKSFSRFPDAFSPFFINMVKSGETSGKLSDVLLFLADHLEKENDFQSRVQGAMLYPLMILIVMVGVIILMIYFVFPQIMLIVNDLGAEPPLVSKIVFAVVNFIRKWIIVIILGFGVLGLFIYQYIKTKEGKDLWDRISLNIPILGSILRRIHLSRFAGNLSTLISGGIQIAPALEISGDVVGNEVFKRIILEARDAVRKGEQINTVLARHP